MRRSRCFTLTVAIIALLLYSAGTARSDEPVAVLDEPMQIIPAARVPLPGSKDNSVPTFVIDENGTPTPVPMSTAELTEYRQIYRSIPFNRAEYRVNPNYRHDTTMEVLTGNTRHQTIVQHNFEHKQPVQHIPAPGRPSRFLTPFSGFGNLWGAPIWNYRSPNW